jgi:hypothetical protein
MQELSYVLAGVELIEALTDEPHAVNEPGKPVAPKMFTLSCAFVPPVNAVGARKVKMIGDALVWPAMSGVAEVTVNELNDAA